MHLRERVGSEQLDEAQGNMGVHRPRHCHLPSAAAAAAAGVFSHLAAGKCCIPMFFVVVVVVFPVSLSRIYFEAFVVFRLDACGVYSK